MELRVLQYFLAVARERLSLIHISGRNAGYRPYPYPYYDGMMSDDYNGRMGYSDRNDGRGGMSQGSDGRGSGYRSSGKGEPYDRYRESRRGYTETHSEDDHKKMKDSISDIFDDMEMIATEVWRDKMCIRDRQRLGRK